MEDLDTIVLRTARGWQQQGLAVILVTVARTWGSSPRPPGSLLAINERGETVGSISGGCIEDDLISRIRDEGVQAVCADALPQVQRYGISADQAHRFGLPCGGTIELVLEPLSEKSHLDELLLACEQRRNIARHLHLQTGEAELRAGHRGGVPVLNDHELVTYLGPQVRLIVIGASDLSRFLCQFALSLGFEVIVCDPREEYRASWQLSGVTVTAEMPDDLIPMPAPPSSPSRTIPNWTTWHSSMPCNPKPSTSARSAHAATANTAANAYAPISISPKKAYKPYTAPLASTSAAKLPPKSPCPSWHKSLLSKMGFLRHLPPKSPPASNTMKTHPTQN